jgi:hypothetical protein
MDYASKPHVSLFPASGKGKELNWWRKEKS